MRRINLSPAQLDAALAPAAPAREFDGRGHVIGCGEWAQLWERHWGRAALDSSTIKNLDEMKRRGPAAGCCR